MALIMVPVVKAKGMIEIDTDQLPEEVYREVILQGLKTIVNRGQTKITASEIPDATQRATEAMAKAQETLKDMYAGKVRISGGKAKKATGKINTEAMRIARQLVKDAMKAQGIKVSLVKAKDISAAAVELIEADPEILKEAATNVKAREEKEKAISAKIDLSKIQLDPNRVKAASERKSKVSAKQAGMTVKATPRRGIQPNA